MDRFVEEFPFERKLGHIPSYVQGFRTKTINIVLIQGVKNYILSTNPRLGLPEDAVIVGIYNRTSVSAFDLRQDIENRDLVVNPTRLHITLKDVHSQEILGEIPVSELSRVNSNIYFIEPRRAKEINWSNSKITAADPSTLTTNQVVELTFIYHVPECVDKDYMAIVKNQLYNGINQLGTRKKILEVPTQLNQQRYPISRQTFTGIPDDAILVGMNLVSGRSTDPNIAPLNANAQDALFINLKKDSITLLDNLPIQGLTIATQLQVSNTYIPIEPTKVCELDWSSSQFFISNPAAPANNESILVALHYIQKF